MPLIGRFRKLPKPVFAALLIVVGIAGRVLLLPAANVEPVLVISMFAGAALGGVYAIVVPVAIMAASDAIIYAFVYGSTYGLGSVLGLAAFMYSGFAFVGLCGGWALRRRLVWRTKTVALFTAISIPLTVAYDVWTAFGDWMFIAGPMGRTLPQVYALQVPFTLIHILSSLIFAPILGTTFLAIHNFGVPTPGSAPAEARQDSQ